MGTEISTARPPTTRSTSEGSACTNAISLLVADHRRLERSFEEFQRATSLTREEQLAFDICDAIRVHSQIEREVVYPALFAALNEPYKQRTALAELVAMEELIDEIEHSSPSEDMFYAKIHVLCEMFDQHVREEEKSRGLFAEAGRSPIDLDTLGLKVLELRRDLTGELSSPVQQDESGDHPGARIP